MGNGPTSRYLRSLDLRAPCSIEGCARTIRTGDHPPHYSTFYCGRHYALVPAILKRLKRRHEREWNRLGFYPREAAYRRLLERIERAMRVGLVSEQGAE